MTENIERLKNIVLDAGEAILSVYNAGDIAVEIKGDNSPLTEADKSSHRIISENLQTYFSDIPLLSEEGSDIDYNTRKNWKKYWLVDPLDGTKEFINRNGEFTVNIALIENNIPVFGIIYAPVLGELYWGTTDKGAFLQKSSDSTPVRLPYRKFPERLTAVASRSHSSNEEKIFLNELKIEDIVSRGSSLKFCQVAAGEAQYYVRFGPTMEWDTGAGQAIAVASGAKMTGLAGEPFLYNKENLLNPGFIVSAIK